MQTPAILCILRMKIINTIIILFFITLCAKAAPILDGQQLEAIAQQLQENGTHYDSGNKYVLAAEAYSMSDNTDKMAEMYSKAAIEFELSAQPYQDSGDHGWAGRCYKYAAESYKKSNNTVKANEMYLKTAVEYEKAARDEYNQGYDLSVTNYMYDARAQRWMASSHDDVTENAAVEYEKLAQEYRENGNHADAGYYYQLSAYAYKDSKNISKAREMYLQSADEYNAAGKDNDTVNMRSKADNLPKIEL